MFKKCKNMIFHTKVTRKVYPVIESLRFLPLKFRIITISKLHDGLCELSLKLNAIFGIQILLTSGFSFMVMIIQLYSLYLLVSGKNPEYEFTYAKAWTSAVWGSIFSVLLFGICFTSSKIEEEVSCYQEAIIFYIHLILCNNMFIYSISRQKQDYYFTMQIIET